MLLKLIIIVVVISVIVCVFLFSAMNALTKAKKLSEDQKMQKYNKRFRFYYDFFMTRSLFHKIYEQITSMAVYSMLEARMMTVKFYERALVAAALLFFVGTLGFGDIISGIVLLMFAFVMINVTVTKRIDDVNYRSLKDIAALLSSIGECYTRLRNVPDALNEADCSPLLKRQVTQIYLICTANDSKEKLQEFYRTCPNRIMRTLATTCYIRADVGDDDTKGTPPFKQALYLIKNEVDMEVRRQLNQRLLFKSLNALPFVPLFLYPPIVMFYSRMITATVSVFESMIGYIIKMVVVLACFISYYILAQINNTSIARTDDRILFITKLMYRSKVRDFAHSMVPKVSKKSLFGNKRVDVRRELEKKLTGCISSKTVDYIYLERLCFSIGVFCVSVVFSIIILFSARNAVYNSLTASTMSITLTYTAEQEQRTREYDAYVLGLDALPEREDMLNQFRLIFPKSTQIERDAQADRLIDKYNTWHNLHFKGWFAFIYIGLTLLAWKIPDFLLSIRTKLVRSEAEQDVLQLQTIITILMDTPLDTLSVIYWLSKSSDIHKDILTRCYHDYVRYPEYAIARLKSRSASPEFSAMCDKLLTTISQITLKEAFQDLIAERDNMMKIREVVQLNELKSKRNIAGPIATMPMRVWMVAVFILPIGIVAVRSAISMIGQLSF